MRTLSSREKYLDATFGLHDPELKAVRERLIASNLEFMSISPHEGRLLQFLIKAMSVKRVVEIGTLYGYSALCMAKALPDDGKLITLEKSEDNWRQASEFFAASSVSGRITSLCGTAADLLSGLEGEGPFDLVFIDADKGGYARYLDWAEKNVRKGGWIVGDNTFLWGGVWDEPQNERTGDGQIRAMKEFNLRLSDPVRYNSTLIPTTEGLTVAQKLF